MSVSKKELIQVSSYSRRLRDNVKSILDNYSEILKASKAGLKKNNFFLLKIIIISIHLCSCLTNR